MATVQQGFKKKKTTIDPTACGCLFLASSPRQTKSSAIALAESRRDEQTNMVIRYR
jgi:hypothetical protein